MQIKTLFLEYCNIQRLVKFTEKEIKDVMLCYNGEKIKKETKILYTLEGYDLYLQLPDIVKIKGKSFYKSHKFNRKDNSFKLIEIRGKRYVKNKR